MYSHLHIKNIPASVQPDDVLTCDKVLHLSTIGEKRYVHVYEPCSMKMGLNPFPHNDIFRRPWETNLLKTLWFDKMDSMVP